MFVFWKVWRALFSWNTRLEIHLFALLPTNDVACFKQHVDYFKITFPSYTASPTYEEWTVNMGIQIDSDSYVRSNIEIVTCDKESFYINFLGKLAKRTNCYSSK